jgi:hypothetical protein
MISQPMQGKARDQVLLERQEAVNILTSLGHEVIDTVFTDYIQLHIPLECLARSLMTMASADLVIFLGGDSWKESRGCKTEWECCQRYGIPYVDGIEYFKERLRVRTATANQQE